MFFLAILNQRLNDFTHLQIYYCCNGRYFFKPMRRTNDAFVICPVIDCDYKARR